MAAQGRRDVFSQSQRLGEALVSYSALIKKYKRANPGAPTDDRQRANTLLEVVQSGEVSLREWTVDEVVVFAVRSYAEDLMLRTVKGGRVSVFLDVLHSSWQPNLRDWVFFLRRYCVLGSFRLFVMVLRTNHCVKWRNNKERAAFAKFILVDMPKVDWDDLVPANYPAFWWDSSGAQSPDYSTRPFDDKLIESIIASFVDRPHDISRSLMHKDNILLLTENLGPALTGAACRHLMMFLTRPPQCRCDHVGQEGLETPRLPECICKRAVEKDRRKEYARVVYKELSQHLNALYLDGAEPPAPTNPKLREFTSQELRDCYHRDDSVVLHAGCAFMNCKQNFSRDCRNLMCATHCRKDGTNPCRVSKHNRNEPAVPVFNCLCCANSVDDHQTMDEDLPRGDTAYQQTPWSDDPRSSRFIQPYDNI